MKHLIEIIEEFQIMNFPTDGPGLASVIEQRVGMGRYGHGVDDLFIAAAKVLREQAAEIERLRRTATAPIKQENRETPWMGV
jgi:hypothetical protein